jgi:hypothetical protein
VSSPAVSIHGAAGGQYLPLASLIGQQKAIRERPGKFWNPSGHKSAFVIPPRTALQWQRAEWRSPIQVGTYAKFCLSITYSEAVR